MGQHDVTGKITTNFNFLFISQPIDVPFVFRSLRCKHKKNAFGYRLDSVVNADKITLAQCSEPDSGVVADQAVFAGIAAVKCFILNKPLTISVNKASVLPRHKP